MTITADEYQTFARTTAILKPKAKALNAVEALENLDPELKKALVDTLREAQLTFYSLGISGEGGEIADKIKKGVRGDYDLANMDEERRRALGLELGDTLWYLSNLAAELGYSLTDIMQMNVDKLVDRRARGTSRGDGDNR